MEIKEPTTDQLKLRLRQSTAKSARRKSALKSLMKAYELQVYISKDYFARLRKLTDEYDSQTKYVANKLSIIRTLESDCARYRKEIIDGYPLCGRWHLF